MKKNKILLILIITLILISFTSAQIQIQKYSTGFEISAQKQEIKLCPCSEIIDEILINNKAPYPQVFEITTNQELAQTTTPQITLGPNQQIQIPIILNANCQTKNTKDTYEVTVKSTTGEEQKITRTLEITTCQTINAELYTTNNIKNICEETTYTIKLTNPSTITEEYIIKTKNNQENYNITKYEVTLQPNQISLLNFTYTPNCLTHGTITNEFTIESKKTKLRTDLSHQLEIIPRYDFSIYGTEEITSCREEIIKIPYTVKNEGEIENTYDLRLRRNPTFITLEESQVTLQPNETKTINLIIQPGSRTQNEYEFTIHARSKIINQEAQKKINLILNDCHNAKLEITTPETLRVCQGTQKLELTLKNTGTQQETYTLTTNTPKATINNNTVTLQPQQEIKLDLTINTENFENKIYFEINAYANRNLLKHWSDSIILDVVPKNKCTEIKFPNQYVIYSRNYEENITINIQNTGIKTETYTITYQGNDFLTLQEQIITLNTQEQKTITLTKQKENEEQKHYFSITLKNQNNDTYTKEFKLVITKTPLIEKAINYTKNTPCFLIGLIILLTILIYGFVSIILQKGFGKKTKTIIAIILFIIFATSLIITKIPQPINPKLTQPEDPYSFKIYENKKITLDLNNYITDPDNDTLIFQIENQPTRLNLTLQENILVIQAIEQGNDRFRISAKDNRGGEVITPRYTIEIIPYKKLTTQECYENYCGYINLTLLLILIMIILFTNKKEKQKQKTEEEKPIKIKKLTKKIAKKNTRNKK